MGIGVYDGAKLRDVGGEVECRHGHVSRRDVFVNPLEGQNGFDEIIRGGGRTVLDALGTFRFEVCLGGRHNNRV